MKLFANIVNTLLYGVVTFAVFMPELGRIASREGTPDWKFRLAVILGVMCAYGEALYRKPPDDEKR